MITSILFDLDGTLFDSTEANIKAYSKAFESVGMDLDIKLYKKNFGLRYSEMMDILAPKAPMELRDDIKKAKVRFYSEYLELVQPNDGLISLLRGCTATFKTALVTTASRPNVINLLKYYSVEQELFDVIITGENVVKGKPDPECYITALNKLRSKAENCCIFEDSEVGILAARKAGIQVIKVAM